MFSLCYADTFPCPILAPCACFYQFDPEACIIYRSVPCDTQQLDNFLNTPDPDICILVKANIRVPEFDSPPDILNRFAFTNIYLKWDATLSLKDVGSIIERNREICNWLHTKFGDPELDALLQRIGAAAWRSIPLLIRSKLHHIASKALSQWCSYAAQHYLAPEYVWRTGDNAGKQTMQVLNERWKQKIRMQPM